MPRRTPLYGKHRGTVVDNIDPMRLGRIRATVPEVDGGESGWAMPCVPFVGANAGVFMLPPVGACVWIEYERGDRDCPIWVGGYWASAADVPAFGVGMITLAAGDARICLSDGVITFENGHGATISLTGPSVDVNSGALTVT